MPYAHAQMDPLELTPQFSTALWGGRRLASIPGAPPNGPLAEAWMFSDLPSRPTRVARGPFADQTLREVIAKFPREILGDHAGRTLHHPLLVKFIDARLHLSVQVHPDDRRAKALGHASGKTEAWIVLHAEPKSQIFAGLKTGTTRADLTSAIDKNTVPELLNAFEPNVGDIVVLPAGTVHALGAGITVLEVQQSCDVTYRLFDWNRVDAATGLPRQLHIAESLDCADFESGPIQPRRDSSAIIETEYFQLAVHRRPIRLGGDNRPRLLIAFGGHTRGCVDVTPEAAVLLPASAGECQLNPEPGAWLFEVSLP